MPIVLDNAEIGNVLVDSYESLAHLIEGLDDSAWSTPTRCPGWEVRDVAGHVAGLASDALSGVVETRTADEQAAALRDHTPAEIAAQLRTSGETFRAFFEAIDDAVWDGPSGVPDMTLAHGIQVLGNDAYVHEDDIRAALDLPANRGTALVGSVAYLARMLALKGWGPATLALDGLPEHDIGAAGPKVTGDPHQFVVVACGRADAATLGLDPAVNIYDE